MGGRVASPTFVGRVEELQTLEAGLLFVEAEPVGDRGRFPAAGDPQLG